MEIRYNHFYMSCAEDGRRNVEMHMLSAMGATLIWEVINGDVYSVTVKEKLRRRGIATALWKEAEKYGPICHSRYRTDDGEAWARAVGGDLPEREAV